MANSRKKSPLTYTLRYSPCSTIQPVHPQTPVSQHVLLILFPKVAGQHGEQDGCTGACRDAHFQPEIYGFADGDSLLRQGDATRAYLWFSPHISSLLLGRKTKELRSPIPFPPGKSPVRGQLTWIPATQLLRKVW
jgi:hypothetical protein